MTNRPAWTLTEAVQRTGASRSTLRRYLDAGKFPNAYKDTSRAWRFPLEDLLAAGLSVSEPPTERVLSTPTDQVTDAMSEQVSKLEQALRDERIRADNAERLAASYQANVQDLRRALRMIEVGTSRPEQSPEHTQSTSSEQATDTPATLDESLMSKPEQASAVHGPTRQRGTKDTPELVPAWRRLFSRRT